MSMSVLNRPGRYTGPTLQANAPDAAVSAREQRDYKFDVTTLVRPLKALQPNPTRALLKAATQRQGITDLQNSGGIVAYGSWSVGTGNFKKRRPVPDGAALYVAGDRTNPTHVKDWFTKHPRAERCVALFS